MAILITAGTLIDSVEDVAKAGLLGRLDRDGGGGIMPLSKKGKKILRVMTMKYGKKKGKQVFYSSQKKGTITGTHKT